ncbi:MAG: hypothetical protein GEU80_05240 [Dehalococcoidia bacterium]|nr:hypothetical protein [Dehalococcoidia bacterium]
MQRLYPFRILMLLGLLGAVAALAVAFAWDDSDASTPDPTAVAGSPGEDGPPALEAAVDGKTARLGLGAYIWSVGDDSHTDDTQGIATDAQVLTTGAGGQGVVSGLGEHEPTEVTASVYERPQSGSQEGANRIVWERSGDATTLDASAEGGEVTVDLGDLPAGQYVVQVALQFANGYAEYGFQLDIE